MRPSLLSRWCYTDPHPHNVWSLQHVNNRTGFFPLSCLSTQVRTYLRSSRDCESNMASLTYDTYRVETHLGLQDPLMGPRIRYHNILFFETQADGSGRAIQVNGTIADPTGMLYYESTTAAPEALEAFHKKYYLGQVRAEDYEAVVKLLKGLERPPRQRVFDTKILGYVKCKSDGSRYGDIETKLEYWKYTEWTLERAIPALEKSGLLRSQSIS